MALAPRDLGPAGPPHPDGGWSCGIVAQARALAVPPTVSALVQAAGVLRADGTPEPAAVTWRGARPMMTTPDRPTGAVARLAGRHLYAGQLWAHFGHFLCESLSRLWALDRVGALDGIVFLPKRPGRVQALSAWQREVLALFGIAVPVRVLDSPTEVEDLVIPGPGFGIGAMFAGTPAFRAFVRDRFAPGVAAQGPARVYLSRSGLGGAEGSLLGERRIEAHLERAGYTVLHPQRLPIAAQVEAYRAAQAVVGPDGSAFHMLALADPRPKAVGVILRRSSGVPDGIAAHIAAFTGRAPHRIDALVADWVPMAADGTPGRATRQACGEVDFARLQAGLTDAGLIAADAPWSAPRPRRIAAEVAARAGRRKGLPLVRRPCADRGRGDDVPPPAHPTGAPCG